MRRSGKTGRDSWWVEFWLREIYPDLEFGWLPPGNYAVTVLAPGDTNAVAKQEIRLRSTEKIRAVTMRLP